MTRTKPLTLVLLAALGATVLWSMQVALATGGRAVLIPPFTLAIALVLIGVVIVVMAWPVRRVSRRVAGARVDPFYATRVVMLAKASSLSGALLAGAGLGIVGFLVTRSVLPPAGSVASAAATAAGAVLLLVAGLVAEHWCRIPPDDEGLGGTPETGGTP